MPGRLCGGYEPEMAEISHQPKPQVARVVRSFKGPDLPGLGQYPGDLGELQFAVCQDRALLLQTSLNVCPAFRLFSCWLRKPA